MPIFIFTKERRKKLIKLKELQQKRSCEESRAAGNLCETCKNDQWRRCCLSDKYSKICRWTWSNIYFWNSCRTRFIRFWGWFSWEFLRISNKLFQRSNRLVPDQSEWRTWQIASWRRIWRKTRINRMSEIYGQKLLPSFWIILFNKGRMLWEFTRKK